MIKLNPPYIENMLPPFIINENIIVPFEINRMNIEDQIQGKPRIIVKNPLTNEVLIDGFEGTIDVSNRIMSFSCKNVEFISGQYYKIQVAFSNSKTLDVGYYSSVGIARCIEKPKISILDMNSSSEAPIGISNMGYKYIGYCQLNEPTEKIYSYCFTLKNKETLEVIYTTGEQIHDTSKDTSSTESIDTCYIPTTLDFENEYLLEYSITTINGYKESTSKTLKSGNTVNLDFGNNILIADSDDENGTIVIKIQRKNINKPFTPISYNFILLRSSSKNNFATWDRISILDENNSKNLFNLENALLIGDSQVLWEDATVEHGISYKYALQAYNSFGLLSNKIESNLQQEYNETGLPIYDDNGTLKYTSTSVTANFEDMYLSDGIRQLRVRFNPKISSFKNTILESKMDTIGSKYPFFFRNGTVKYKEFPISGLISLLMDPDDKFITGLYTENTATRVATPGTSIHAHNLKTNVIDENIKNEREFKLEVLDWLTNGQPKIFRSPTEGNYLVRLMNTSLSPNDTLGRMLHTFSCTAYEIDDFKFETLHNYGFINCETQNYRMASFIGAETITLSECIKKNKKIINFPGAYYIELKENRPNKALYKINFSDGSSLNELSIGNSGIYKIPSDIGFSVESIEWQNWDELKNWYLNNPCEQNDIELNVTYSYYDKINLTNFHFIENVTFVPAIIQNIGQFEFVNPNNHSYWNEETAPNPSIIATWGVREVDKLYRIRIKRRPLIPLYQDDEKNLYFNIEKTDPFSFNNKRFLYQGLYLLEDGTINDYYNYSSKNTSNVEPTRWNINDKELFIFTINDDTFQLNLNNQLGNSHEIYENYEYTTFELDTDLLQNMTLDYLKIGNGLILEMVYLAKDLHYNFSGYIDNDSGEQDHLDGLKKDFQEAKKRWFNSQDHLGAYNYYIPYLNNLNFIYEAWYDYVDYLKNLIEKVTKNEEVTIT